MIVYKHKQSGKHFIFIDELETDIDQAIFVTPPLDGKIRIINQPYSMFEDDPIEGNEKDLIFNGIITVEQVFAYQTYRENRRDEREDNFIFIWKQMSDFEKKESVKKSFGIDLNGCATCGAFKHEKFEKIIEELDLKEYSFNNILSSLRKKKLIVNNSINSKIIPKVEKNFKKFQLIYDIEII